MHRTKSSEILIAVIVVGVIWCAGCSDAAESPQAQAAAPAQPVANVAAPAPAPVQAVNDGPPSIEFNKLIHDFGTMYETGNTECTFEFTNSGGELLIIHAVNPSCGCTAVALEKRQFAPGEGDALHVSFSPTTPGEQHKLIKIVSNDSKQPTIELMIKANVIPFLEIIPRRVEFGPVSRRVENRQFVRVRCADPNYEITGVWMEHDFMAASLLSEADAKAALPFNDLTGERVIEVKLLTNTAWGLVANVLNIRAKANVDGELKEYTSAIRVQASAYDLLMADPDTFRMGVKPNEPFTREIMLRLPTGGPFQILGASVDDKSDQLSDETVRWEPINQRGTFAYRLILEGRGAARPGPIRTSVHVNTDIPGESVTEIPVVGVTR